MNWYEHFSKKQDKRCFIPKGLKCFQNENECLIVMQDLATLGFTHTTKEPSKTHLATCLKWLANFHAKHMHTQNKLLWKTGTYWHLATRPDELAILKDKELKTFAPYIDEALKNATYQTLVHGDAKLANFCFTEDATECAGIDFQYVGQGCGMKDVALFISSAVAPEKCKALESWLLKTYFSALREALGHYQPHLDALAVEKEYQELFCVAWADFQRFIKGWSPEHFKINAYTEALSAKAIAYLKEKHAAKSS